MRILLVFSGLALSAAGFFCMLNSGQVFAPLAFATGMGLLSSALFCLAAWLLPGTGREIRSLPLADGIVSALLAVALLNGRIPDGTAACAIFGFWLISSGAARAAASFGAPGKPLGFRVLLLAAGLAGAACGLYGFFHPLLLDMTSAMLVGCFFLIQGIASIAVGIALAGKARRGRPKGKGAAPAHEPPA
ncbi:MAG: DUF308 domain-containing protein [Clostridiales Family XIII bacterium]|jgi:uncharacterized membrane protein HdeD (DUF308 family)|nr:DUF308 domain-containing protein [Clostridiales Family XIII bacterium]